MKTRAFVVVLLLAVMAVPCRALSLDRPLRLGSVDNIPPYVFRQGGRLTGLSVEIIAELARRGGFEVEIETSPWARVLLRLEQGGVDGAFSAYMTKERKAFCLYTGIIHYDELRVAVKKGREFSFTGIESLYGKAVGKGRGGYVSKPFDQAVKEGRIVLDETDDMKMLNVKKLHEGRLDAVIGSPIAMLYYAQELGLDDIVLLPGVLKERIPAYLVLSRHSILRGKKAWQRKLAGLLAEMHADGTIRAIYRRYGVNVE